MTKSVRKRTENEAALRPKSRAIFNDGLLLNPATFRALGLGPKQPAFSVNIKNEFDRRADSYIEKMARFGFTTPKLLAQAGIMVDGDQHLPDAMAKELISEQFSRLHQSFDRFIFGGGE